VDAVFGTLEGVAALYDFVRSMRKRFEPEPFPLTHKAVEHQQQQIRKATTILPPRP
jgi:hypothetical protein